MVRIKDYEARAKALGPGLGMREELKDVGARGAVVDGSADYRRGGKHGSQCLSSDSVCGAISHKRNFRKREVGVGDGPRWLWAIMAETS